MKTLPVISAFVVLMAAACFTASCNPKAQTTTDTFATDSAAIVNPTPADTTAESSQPAIEQQQAEGKEFLEKFYAGYEKDITDYAFIRKHVTKNAEQYLKDSYDYDCETDDCLAVWVFAYEAGGDIGPLKKRVIEPVDASTFKVRSVYKYTDQGDYEYVVKLSLVKDGDSYKIDQIEPIGEKYPKE